MLNCPRWSYRHTRRYTHLNGRLDEDLVAELDRRPDGEAYLRINAIGALPNWLVHPHVDSLGAVVEHMAIKEGPVHAAVVDMLGRARPL